VKFQATPLEARASLRDEPPALVQYAARAFPNVFGRRHFVRPHAEAQARLFVAMS
jgi:hypothetical protein